MQVACIHAPCCTLYVITTVLLLNTLQDTFDPAVLRSGRFGMQIQFEAPDRDGREQLFTHYLKSMKLTTAQVCGLLACI
jgi:ATP-dependent 26S proteasome regulatory subunit